MKFIKNSIDSAYLQDTISDSDLEKQMANCEMESVLNGHHSEVTKISAKNNMEVVEIPEISNGVEIPEISNGIHGKCVTPTKCNGKVNGFYEEEDFNLVLEDSSESGDSPSKKIDDDNISAPQIVQEIEDLLGINSSSAGIQEELNSLDGIESIEDNLDNEDTDESQEIQGVFEEIDEHKAEQCKQIDNEKVDNSNKITKLAEKSSGTSECDTSTHMDLVYSEVEVGMENGDLSIPNESNLTVKTGDIECKVGSTTENINPVKGNNLVTSTSKDTTTQDGITVNNDQASDVAVENSDEEIPSTQSSGASVNLEEWMVLDATETSDEEKNSESQELSETTIDINNVLPLPISSGMKDDLQADLECPVVASDANETLVHLVEEKDISEKPLSTSLLLSEGDTVRKRCAPVGDEEVELKKPKLEENSLGGNSSSVFKRPLPVTVDNGSKRTKLCEKTEELKTLDNKDCQVKEESEKEENQIIKTLDSNYCQVKEKLEEVEIDASTQPMKDDKNTDVPVKSKLSEETPVNEEKNISNIPSTSSNQEDHETSRKEETHSVASSCADKSKMPSGNDVLRKSPVMIQQAQEALIHDKPAKDNDKGGETGYSSAEVSDMTLKEDELTESATSKENSDKIIVNNVTKSGFEEIEMISENRNKDCIGLEERNQSDDKKNVSGIRNEEVGFKLDDLTSVSNKDCTKLEKAEKISDLPIKAENKITDRSKQVSIRKELSTSIKELEKSLNKSGSEKAQSSENVKSTEPKKMTNLDFAIERVVEKARIQTEKKVPILKKFHKDQLKKLTRTELEEIVVSKICEAVSYKSEIGQMRLRTQTLEETNEMWRKKVQQIEKQNRELEMVLKRFLAELAHIKRENQNKVPMPIKVTRSVGLQVVLASSMHGALVSSRAKMSSEVVNQQQQQSTVKIKPVEKEKVKEPAKSTTFLAPNHPSTIKTRGRPSKILTPQNSRPSTPQTQSPRVTPPTTPAKPVTPVKTIPTPNKDLEVIDLTDKEEKAKSASQNAVSGAIRVAPSTQVCFVQQSTAPSTTQQPLYIVQKAGQRSQFLVATSSTSPQRQVNNMSRPPPALALPVFRASGTLIPVQTNHQVGVKTSPNTTPTPVTRQVPPLRVQPPANKVNTIQHPAPLPASPMMVSKPGMKAPPPKPQLKIAKTANGIMLSWSMSLTKDMAEMQSYQLYAYQEGNQPPSTGLWKKVGDVKALPLPMACTLTQFIEGHKYHFAVRAVDTHNRIGPFSTPSSILLTK